MRNIKIEGMVQFLGLTLMVAALYAITGVLGLNFATGSAYSTAIWIPSGIALGATLVFGLRALPGVFIGSLYINFNVTAHGTFGVSPLLIGSLIATGATLQALFGWYLVRKWLGLQNHLTEPNDIMLFALLTGPVSCLVNASTSNLMLLTLHVLPVMNLWLSWLTWYIGDSIGVLIFTPIFLIIFAEPRVLWRSRIVPILLPLCVSFLIVTISFIVAKYIGISPDQLWFMLSVGCMMCILINITLFITHGQKQLMQQEMRQILTCAGEGIYGVDMNERIIFVNPSAENMWNNIESDLVGKSIHDLISNVNEIDKHIHEIECPIYAAIHNNKASKISNVLLIRSDGTSFWAEYTCTPLLVANRTKGAVLILNDITRRREAEFHLERLAHYDILTGLPNRFSFIEELKKQISQPDIYERNLTVCFLDLDNFKNINDTLGHACGDIALQKLALIIANSIDDTDYFARLGGDEFGIIVYNKTSTQVDHMLSHLVELVGQPIELKDIQLNLSISIGVASYRAAGTTADELIKNADIAMYSAKEAGKNTFKHYNADLSRTINRSHSIENELRNAIPNNEFSLFYQPQVEVSTGKVTGLEALLRWNNSLLGNVAPDEFIPIAEKTGLIHPIGEWVLQQVERDYQSILQSSTNQLRIAINVSVMQLMDMRFYNSLKQTLENTYLGNVLILEITETAFIANPVRTLELMQMITKLGVEFALDDFGMNYSSMRYIKNLPIAQIKIDYFFTKDIAIDSNNLAIVNTIVQLANGLSVPAIAEGIETKAQLDLIMGMGGKYVQGYYFYKPMPLNTLLMVLKNKVF